jgi:ankyrin repeat protein
MSGHFGLGDPSRQVHNRLNAIVRRAETGPGLSDEEAKEIQRLQDMIQNSPDLINAPHQGPNGDLTPLQDAADKGQLAVARFLLENHADVNAGAGSAQGTPLHFAAANGHKTMAELLLAHGAQVNARNRPGETPLFLAALHGFQAVAEVLLAHGADVNAQANTPTPLQVAAANRHPRMAELLLAHKADIDAQDTSGDTALMMAVRGNDTNLVNLLLAHHADPNLKHTKGATALSISIFHGNAALTQTLLEHGADPNEETPSLGGQGFSRPLIYAAPNAALIELLLRSRSETGH